ncbi:MAG: esterase/lipase family protein [Solirubrobacterales bacterium]
MTRRLRTASLLAAGAAALVAGAPATASAEPRLEVPAAKLKEALHCYGDQKAPGKVPIMLVTGTGASGREAYTIGKGAFDEYGAPVCTVDFPFFTTGDIHVSVQYLAYGIREQYRMAGRKIAVFGISQGGLLPRVALTYWPSLRPMVADVIAAAGTQHGTTASADQQSTCRTKGCIPAGWQQRAGSKMLATLNSYRTETPGPTSWTTLRSTDDETVKPTTGPKPTSSLKGATNILIQDVCPGRVVSHIGTAVDSVTFAAIRDAIENPGPAKVDRFPAGLCSNLFAPGLNPASTGSLVGAAGGLTGGRNSGANGGAPLVKAEPKVPAWARKAARSRR